MVPFLYLRHRLLAVALMFVTVLVVMATVAAAQVGFRKSIGAVTIASSIIVLRCTSIFADSNARKPTSRISAHSL